MKVRNVTSRQLLIAATGDVVDPNETVEVSKDVGELLLEQTDVWTSATTRKTTAPADDEIKEAT